MAQVTIQADIYSLSRYNSTSALPNNKNNLMKLGGYSRGSLSYYEAEILCRFNMALIPATSIISAVEFKVNIESTAGAPWGGFSFPLKVFKENKIAWLDSGLSPNYNTFEDVAWTGTTLAEYLLNDSITGLISIPLNSTGLITLVSDWFNGGVANDGVILSLDNHYYNWYIRVNQVQLIVTYDTPPIRRVLICS